MIMMIGSRNFWWGALALPMIMVTLTRLTVDVHAFYTLRMRPDERSSGSF
jgi:hypothetical protein